MSFDYSRLRGKIIEKFGTLGAFAVAMEWSEKTNGLKLNSVNEWKQGEIIKASALLDINPEQYNEFFFTKEVQ